MTDRQTRIVIAGFGGQGVVLAGQILATACIIEGRNVTQMVSYGAEMRGGTANSSLVISDGPIVSPYFEVPDAAVILNQPSFDRFAHELRKDGLAVVNTSTVTCRIDIKGIRIVKTPATDIAHRLGNIRIANMAALGAFIGVSELLEPESVVCAIRELFAKKDAALVDLNTRAFYEGLNNSPQND